MVRPLNANQGPWMTGVSRALARARGRVAVAIEAWREQMDIDCELAKLAANGEVDGTLAEIGLSRIPVPSLLRGHPGATQQVNQMMQRVGIEPADLPAMHGLREIELRCMRCRTWEGCQIWLESKAMDEAWRMFCPNAAVFEAGSRRRHDDTAQVLAPRSYEECPRCEETMAFGAQRCSNCRAGDNCRARKSATRPQHH